MSTFLQNFFKNTAKRGTIATHNDNVQNLQRNYLNSRSSYLLNVTLCVITLNNKTTNEKHLKYKIYLK
jgi:hypothetical protein